jgi:hypothetical protein
MDLARMLDKCVRDQWSVEDLDWKQPPPADMPRDKEEAIVQYFTDMAGIERLAKALFAVQARKVPDPTLRAIFDSFVIDEERHAVAAERLARYYDVHHHRAYRMNETLVRFAPQFLQVVELMPPEIANGYITAGELLLDVALLRSLDDYVGDRMSHAAMHLINRDESRHIAIDFHMTEHYASDEFLAETKRRPKRPIRERATGMAALARVMWHAQPFLQGVFLAPMERTDPEGKRMREAFKRMQLLSRKPTVARLPFIKFMLWMQRVLHHPRVGPVLKPVLLRVMGGDERAVAILLTDEELERAQRMSFDELADEALAAKLS